MLIDVDDTPVITQHPSNVDWYVLVHDFQHGDIKIPAGFVTDFASIPKLFWNVIGPLELGDVGPLCHDWRYKNGIGTKSEADEKFLADMKAEGVSWIKRSLAYRAVRWFGGSSWNSKSVVIEKLSNEEVV